MRIDLYTKIVLTVIAVCLLFIAFKSSFNSREAIASGTQDVWVEGGYITVESNYRSPVYVNVVNWP